MQVRELLEKLQEFSPEQEVVICRGSGGIYGHQTTDLDDVFEHVERIGLATTSPKDITYVVLDSGMCGL